MVRILSFNFTFKFDPLLTLKQLYSLPNLMLVKNRCLAVTCPAASFVIRDRCSPCNVGTTTFANNKLPQCPKCSTGASACTARGATACSIGYKLNGVKCTAQNTYDFIQ